MFNNIIYLIIVLLVFSTGPSGKDQTEPLFFSISMIFLLWIILVVYCGIGFKRLANLYQKGLSSGYASMYNRLVLKLSILAIFIFSLDVFAFNFKSWIEAIPIIGSINIVQGLTAIILFIIYLSTIWYFAHPAYNLVFNTDIRKKAFIFWNIRLNIPVVFFWLFLLFVLDVSSISPWPELNSFIETPLGQVLLLVIILFPAMIFLPVLVQYFWGCRPIESSIKAEGIRYFLKEIGVRYRELVSWPLLGGKMITAGIMGVIPRFRYILVTESLMEILSPYELKAVMAHEAGHAKYYHQLFLTFLFLGFFVLFMGFVDSGFYETLIGYLIYRTIGTIESVEIYTAVFTFPILVTLVIYFRFIMGFFMRNFERQADAYAAQTIGDPSPVISSLEKIALLSGKIREVPSWHHFSIKQRVDFLMKSQHEPEVILKHRRFLLYSFLAYLGIIFSLAYFLYLTPVTKHFSYYLLSRALIEDIEKDPKNIELNLRLAGIYYKWGRFDKASETYEAILILDRKNPGAMNDLAWILLRTDDPDKKDIKRGFELAKEAVDLKPLPEYLDTLAEAYWLNGDNKKAIKLEKEAIMRDKSGNPHYRKQLEKFMSVKK